MSDPYDVFLFSQNQYQEVDLIEPEGTYVHYVRISPGTGFADAVFQSTDPGPWNQAIVARNQARAGWDVTFRDGRKWFFPQFQPVTEMTDSNGNVTHIIRQDSGGSAGKIAQVVAPGGRTVSFSYNAAGFVSAVTDNLGRTVSYGYDGSGRLTDVTNTLGGTRHYTWDTTGNRITGIQDANGNSQIQNQYDSAGRVTQQTVSNGGAFSYAYTTQNGVTTQTDTTDPRGAIRRVNFDASGYVVKNTFPLGLPEQQVITYEVDHGVMSASVDALNRRTEYVHDSAGNTTQITRMAGTSEAISVHIAYAATLAAPLALTDANGNTTAMTYDGKGNVLAVHDPLGQVTSFTYDSRGQMLTRTNPLGRVSTLAYDGVDLSSVRDPLGRQVQTFTDPAGRTIATIDPTGNRTTLDWDDLDRLISVTDAHGGVTSYGYDANGNQISHTDANGHTTSYTFTASNQVATVTDPLSHGSSAVYEPGGLLVQSIDRRGLLSTTTYDVLGRASTVSLGATAAQPTAFTSRIAYTWDAGNRLTRIEDSACADPVNHVDCSSVASSRVVTRAYDDFDRLISEVTPQGEIDYTYDAGRAPDQPDDQEWSAGRPADPADDLVQLRRRVSAHRHHPGRRTDQWRPGAAHHPGLRRGRPSHPDHVREWQHGQLWL